MSVLVWVWSADPLVVSLIVLAWLLGGPGAALAYWCLSSGPVVSEGVRVPPAAARRPPPIEPVTEEIPADPVLAPVISLDKYRTAA